MADIIIDTNNPNYKRMVADLGPIEAYLQGKKRALKRTADKGQLKWWTRRDPLLKRLLQMTSSLSRFVDLSEIEE